MPYFCRLVRSKIRALSEYEGWGACGDWKAGIAPTIGPEMFDSILTAFLALLDCLTLHGIIPVVVFDGLLGKGHLAKAAVQEQRDRCVCFV